MSILCLGDTETTGCPDNRANVQCVQVGAMLYDTVQCQVIAGINAILQPNGWEIPEGAAAIHGITTAHAQAYGLPAQVIAMMMHRFLQMADEFVAFGVGYDTMILTRFLRDNDMDDKRIVNIKKTCVMRMATPVCKIPPTEKMLNVGNRSFKTPNLTEAYKLICGKDLVGAHGAWADISATLEIYQILTNGGK